jgi:hypothetical protein
MQPADTYPNLARYVKSAVITSRIRKIKQPLVWLRYGVLIPTLWAVFTQQWAFILPCIFLSFAFDYASEAIRFKTWKFQELYRLAMGARIPMVIKAQMDKGTFSPDPRLGKALDHNAQLTLEIAANYVDLYALRIAGPRELKKSFQNLVNAADTLMLAALNSMYRPLMMRVQPSDDELAEAARIEADLQVLHDEADQIRRMGKRPALDAAAQETIDRVKATIDCAKISADSPNSSGPPEGLGADLLTATGACCFL